MISPTSLPQESALVDQAASASGVVSALRFVVRSHGRRSEKAAKLPARLPRSGERGYLRSTPLIH